MSSYIMAVDIGNTSIMVGIFSSTDLLNHWRLRSSMNRTSDEWGILLNNLTQQVGLKVTDVEGIIISSVVPSINPTFIKMCQDYYGVDPVFVSSELDLGITIQYDDPRMVGADRLCVVVAGYKKYGAPLIIIDFGTATTFDVILRSGTYTGGIIAPGIETASGYLHQRAAKLPQVELQFPEKIIGSSTETSIQSGILYGTVAQVDGLVSMIHKEIGENCPVVATGGLSSLIHGHTQSITHVEPLLVLKGLYEIYLRIRQ